MRLLILTLALLLPACAAPKASIPEDLVPVCHKGQLGAVSEMAQEVILWALPCGGSSV